MDFSDWSTAQQERLGDEHIRARTNSLPLSGEDMHTWMV